MAGWKKLICWLAGALAAIRRWHHERGVKWENRYIIQYDQQIADAIAGIEEVRKRRAAAEARRRKTSPRPGLVSGKEKS